MASKGRHFLGQNESWQKGSFSDKSLLGGKFLGQKFPLGESLRGKRSLSNRLRGVQNKHEKCKRNVNIIDFPQIFHRFLVR